MGVADGADMVAVGAGLAGHCAALAAAEAGATVLLLEKETRIGGSTVLSGGFFALAGTAAFLGRAASEAAARQAAAGASG